MSETLDQVLERLKAVAGPAIDPVRASQMAELRDPTAFAPTRETIALARQFQAHELRLKRARARREAWAELRESVRTYIRSHYRAILRWFGYWS